MTQPVYNSGIQVTLIPAEGKVIPEKFQIKVFFPNNHCVSIVYGQQVYSHNMFGERFQTVIPSTDVAGAVEIAILDPQNQFVKFRDGEEIKPFATLNDLLSILNWVSTR